MLSRALTDAGGAEALRFGDRALTYEELHHAAAAVAGRVRGAARVAVWAVPALETCVGVVGALAAGAAVVPINPNPGGRELSHTLGAARPGLAPAPPAGALPPALAQRSRIDVRPEARGRDLPP